MKSFLCTLLAHFQGWLATGKLVLVLEVDVEVDVEVELVLEWEGWWMEFVARTGRRF